MSAPRSWWAGLNKSFCSTFQKLLSGHCFNFSACQQLAFGQTASYCIKIHLPFHSVIHLSQQTSVSFTHALLVSTRWKKKCLYVIEQIKTLITLVKNTVVKAEKAFQACFSKQQFIKMFLCRKYDKIISSRFGSPRTLHTPRLLPHLGIYHIASQLKMQHVSCPHFSLTTWALHAAQLKPDLPYGCSKEPQQYWGTIFMVFQNRFWIRLWLLVLLTDVMILTFCIKSPISKHKKIRHFFSQIIMKYKVYASGMHIFTTNQFITEGSVVYCSTINNT